MYDAEGEARKAAAAAISLGSPILPTGISRIMLSRISSSVLPDSLARVFTRSLMRPVSNDPGKRLFTVIPYDPSSEASVLAQLATAPRTVLETPSPRMGTFTEVEMTLIIRPYRARFIPSRHAFTRIWLHTTRIAR